MIIHLVKHIFMLHSPSKFLQFEGIKNEGLEVVQTPPNPSPSFLKKHPNQEIKLLSLPVLYSPSSPQHPNIALISHALIQEEKEGKSTYFHSLNVFKVLMSSSVFY